MTHFAMILLVRPLIHLRTLNLFSVNLFEHALCAFLGRCRRTLIRLNLDNVLLESASWTNIFIQIRDACCHLEFLRLQELLTSSSSGTYQLLFDAQLRSYVTGVTWEPREREVELDGYDPAIDDIMVVKSSASVHNAMAVMASRSWNSKEWPTKVVDD